MTARQLLRWQGTHARRMIRARGIATSGRAVAVAATASVGLLVAWRSQISVTGASHAWLGATLAVFAVAFMRVPSHLYWRADAAFLAQLPISGGALQDVALVRCFAAAATATTVAVVGALPLLGLDPDLVGATTRELQAIPIAGDPVERLTPLSFFVRHAALASVLGLAAAALIPAAALWSASLVATGRADRAIRTATGMAGGGNAEARRTEAPPPSSGAALLGAVPGAAASAVIAVVILVAPWLHNRSAPLPTLPVFVALALAGIGSLAAVRAAAARAMPAILREMAALDRQQLATLELNPPTAIERRVASLLRGAAVPFQKDARLMRRRYPMAFALGAVTFATFTAIGLARPYSTAWLIAVTVVAAAYSAVLAGRLHRPPVELARLSATLPISAAERARAKLVWLATWTVLFVALPATFALLRGR